MSENATANKEQAKTKAMEIKFDEHLSFDPICDSKFLSSKDLCTLISQMFRDCYADYEGCTFEFVPGSTIPMISLYFNHKNYDGADLPVACSKDIDEDNTVNNTLRRVRSYQNALRNGDRFHLTPEGKDGLADFLISSRNLYKNKNGEVDWKKIHSDVSDPNAMYMGGNGMGTQYTKVSYLDPNKIVAAMFGDVDETKNRWEYGVRVIKSMPTVGAMMGYANNNPSEWMLAIDRVCEQHVTELARRFGYSVNSGLPIIR